VQVLVFHVGEERYAIETRVLLEVVPAVPLREVPGTAPALAGLLDYRGHVVPVVDLCRLFGRGPCPERLRNRIMVCDLVAAGAVAPDAPPAERLVGALAEDVTRIARLDPERDLAHPGPVSPGVPALGALLRSGEGLLQLVDVGDLIPADLRAALAGRADAREGA
jgi:chemotaxis-related protein WspB